MGEIATASDVAQALGLASSDDLPADQAARLEGELARVEREFTRAAGRKFTEGPVRVQAVALGGWITLPDEPTVDPVTVTDRDGNPLVAVRDGTQVKVSRDGVPVPSGTIVNVDYDAPGPPEAVTAAVAAIVARRLSVKPGSPESKFTELSTLDYRAKGAAWVASTSVLTDEEKSEAAGYRPPQGVAIIARWQ